MSWPARIHMAAPAGALVNSRQAAAAWDPDAGGARTWSVPLTAGQSPTPTHWGASTQATGAMLAAITAALEETPGARWGLGGTWGEFLDAVGLQPIDLEARGLRVSGLDDGNQRLVAVTDQRQTAEVGA